MTLVLYGEKNIRYMIKKVISWDYYLELSIPVLYVVIPGVEIRESPASHNPLPASER